MTLPVKHSFRPSCCAASQQTLSAVYILPRYSRSCLQRTSGTSSGVTSCGPYTTLSFVMTPGIAASSSLLPSLYHLVSPGIYCFWMRLIMSSAHAVPFAAFSASIGRTPPANTMPAFSVSFVLSYYSGNFWVRQVRDFV